MTGLDALEAESDRLWALECELHSRIVNWPVQTFDEVKQIAGYLAKIDPELTTKADAFVFLEKLAA